MATVLEDVRQRLEALVDDHRDVLRHSLDGLTEQEVRARPVPSATTLLGPVEHVTHVEGAWFDQAVPGRTTQQIGIASTPGRSFVLRREDTAASVRAAHRAACERSRTAVADLPLDAVVTGRGPLPPWGICAHVLRELAQHCGHADILREQVLAAGPR